MAAIPDNDESGLNPIIEAVTKGEKTDDGRYILTLDQIADIVAHAHSAGKSGSMSAMAQDAARRMVFDERFPDAGRLHGRPRAEPPPPSAREKQFPNANRLVKSFR